MTASLAYTHTKFTRDEIVARAARLYQRSRWPTAERLLIREYDDYQAGMGPLHPALPAMLRTVRQVNARQGRRRYYHDSIRTTRLYVTDYCLAAQLLARRYRAWHQLVLQPCPVGWHLANVAGAPPLELTFPHLAAAAQHLQSLENLPDLATLWATVCGLLTTPPAPATMETP